jgi:alpha-L-fucosidase
MSADSPVTFPEKGALPAKYPPDVSGGKNQATEPGDYIFKTPQRSLKQIKLIQSEMPVGTFTAPALDWTRLSRTQRLLSDGGNIRLLALGDSIVNDMMRSGWVAELAGAYPKARVDGTVYVRGGGGCQYYRLEGRVAREVVSRKPDLVIIGGISQRSPDDIREVIHQLRAGLPQVEVLLVSGAFGTTDPRDAEALAKAPHSGTGPYGRALAELAGEESCAYLDLTAPWAQYIVSTKLHPHRFYRDVVHANEFGEQIFAKILMAAFAPDVRGASGEAQEPWLKERLEWFSDLKFGFMIHWGAYSQWGCIESWPLVEVDKWARPDDLAAWVERGKDLERFKRDYWALPKTFNPVKFDPDAWAASAKQAGMRYVVFTTKHHDGFSMFDTRLSDYRVTAPDVPFGANPRANVAREVFDSFRKQGFGIGAYFSKADWHSPYYWDPSRPARTRNPNYDTRGEPERWAKFVEYTHGQVEELMSGYGAIDILWLDAGQVRPPDQDIQMEKLAAMARRHQPKLIIADRTVGGRFENYRTPEQEVPDKPLPYAWETCMTMGDSWAFKPNDRYKSAHRLIQLLVEVVGKGGNFLLNVGPQPDGQLPEPALERMREIGAWLEVNGEAIYGTRPVAPYKEGDVVFTAKGEDVYAIVVPRNEGEAVPEKVRLKMLKPGGDAKVMVLGTSEAVSWKTTADGVEIAVPGAVRAIKQARHGIVLRWKVDGAGGRS